MASHALQTPVANVGTPGAPAFLNAWRNYQNGLQWCSFWKDTNGICHVRGMVTGGRGGYGARGYSTPFAIFQLPAGFRPGGIERFASAAYPGGLKGAPVTIPALTVSSGGSTPATPLENPPLGGTWIDVLSDTYGGYVVAWQDCTISGFVVSLSGISFFADH